MLIRNYIDNKHILINLINNFKFVKKSVLKLRLWIRKYLYSYTKNDFAER